MQLYNSATHQKEEFIPHVPGKVSMYTCGPTVYHFAHIGNLRTYMMEDVLELAERLDTMVCWDFGHANLTGLCQSVELEKLRGRVRCVHIHDNDGVKDTHRIPFDPSTTAPMGGSIDWEDAAEGLRLCEFLSSSNKCLNLELKSSDLPSDPAVRNTHASRALFAAERLSNLL